MSSNQVVQNQTSYSIPQRARIMTAMITRIPITPSISTPIPIGYLRFSTACTFSTMSAARR